MRAPATVLNYGFLRGLLTPEGRSKAAPPPEAAETAENGFETGPRNESQASEAAARPISRPRRGTLQHPRQPKALRLPGKEPKRRARNQKARDADGYVMRRGNIRSLDGRGAEQVWIDLFSLNELTATNMRCTDEELADAYTALYPNRPATVRLVRWARLRYNEGSLSGNYSFNWVSRRYIRMGDDTVWVTARGKILKILTRNQYRIKSQYHYKRPKKPTPLMAMIATVRDVPVLQRLFETAIRPDDGLTPAFAVRPLRPGDGNEKPARPPATVPMAMASGT